MQVQSREPFSAKSDEFLVPTDYKTIFSSQHALGVSEAFSDDLSPVSPVFSGPSSAQFASQDTVSEESKVTEDFTFSLGFRRVCSEFEKTALEFESNTTTNRQKKSSEVAESPRPSDSEQEFFDCQQDFFESEDVMPEDEITYFSEHSSISPRSSSDMGILKVCPEHTTQHLLQVEPKRQRSSGSESLDEFDYDLHVSRECAAEGGFPICEQLLSRDRAGFYNDDDFLGMVRGCA